jgi:CheY-like chemotaxis protein
VAQVVALVPDLLFGSKVIAMLEAAGHTVERCEREDAAWASCDAGADVLVVDLASDAIDGVALVDSMRSGGELHGVRTLGFYSHVDVDTKERAVAAGFDLVVPRSRMAREGDALVARLAGES